MTTLARSQVGIIQRAFEMAREGSLENVHEIQQALKKEGYESTAQHLAGPTITRQLKAAIAARASNNNEPSAAT